MRISRHTSAIAVTEDHPAERDLRQKENDAGYPECGIELVVIVEPVL